MLQGFLNENRQKGHHMGLVYLAGFLNKKKTKRTPYGGWNMLQGF